MAILNRYLDTARAGALRLIAAMLALLPASSFAAQQVADVTLRTDLESEAAVGLLISQNGTRQVTNTEIIRPEQGVIIVSIPYDDAKIEPGTLITAMVTAKDGAFVMGELRELPPPGVDPQPREIPLCPEEPAGLELARAMTSIHKLVEIRSKLVETGRRRIENMFTEDLLNKLKKFEKGFGLAQEPPLRAEMSPFELVDRLQRILNALKTYAFFRPNEEDEN